jgi:hypothetical protein
MFMSTSPDLNSNTSGTPLGSYLIEAGLITSAQVSVVLNDQQVATDMRFGEVLVARGWVKLETIEFIMTRVVEPERRATQGRNLSESLPESNKQTPASPAHKIPHYPVRFSTDHLTETLVAPPAQTSKPTPPPYPPTPPVIARARSLDGDFELEILDSLADTGPLSGASSEASKTNARPNDRKPLPSVPEDGGVNWAG